jgi:hypothetical protein
LPLLGSSRRRPEANQDSPDSEGPQYPPEFQQLAAVYASSCHPMLEFAGSRAVLCRTLLTQMLEFAACTPVVWARGPALRGKCNHVLMVGSNEEWRKPK